MGSTFARIKSCNRWQFISEHAGASHVARQTNPGTSTDFTPKSHGHIDRRMALSGQSQKAGFLKRLASSARASRLTGHRFPFCHPVIQKRSIGRLIGQELLSTSCQSELGNKRCSFVTQKGPPPRKNGVTHTNAMKARAKEAEAKPSAPGRAAAAAPAKVVRSSEEPMSAAAYTGSRI